MWADYRGVLCLMFRGITAVFQQVLRSSARRSSVAWKCQPVRSHLDGCFPELALLSWTRCVARAFLVENAREDGGATPQPQRSGRGSFRRHSIFCSTASASSSIC
ncbi:hypothetical protein VTI74DRAFT_973 [Chaetomium olivicolor]